MNNDRLGPPLVFKEGETAYWQRESDKQARIKVTILNNLPIGRGWSASYKVRTEDGQEHRAYTVNLWSSPF